MSRPPQVAVIDYGHGNLHSVEKALVRSGLAPEVTGDPDVVRRAEGVVLPGVGAFADAAESLRAKGLDAAIRESIGEGRPYLGLCLGLQLLFEASDEHGHCEGFGLLAGRVVRFPEKTASGERLLVPHIGWNEVAFSGAHPMLARLPERDYFYFVHAYHALPADPAVCVGRTEHGASFASVVATERIFAVQFHPEKSQAAGRRLLDAYAAWVTECR